MDKIKLMEHIQFLFELLKLLIVLFLRTRDEFHRKLYGLETDYEMKAIKISNLRPDS